MSTRFAIPCSVMSLLGLHRVLLWFSVCLVATVSLSACDSSSIDPESPLDPPTPSPTPVVRNTPENGNVILSGRVTYDFVPHIVTGALNYNAMRDEPAKGVVVQLIDEEGIEVQSTLTDALGNYQFETPRDMPYRVRALAQLRRAGSPAWDISVVDNTDNEALYGIEGSLLSSGDGGLARDLHADSGWDGSSYVRTRAAAPFAILDSIYQVLAALERDGLVTSLPPLVIGWSAENRPAPGKVSEGDIGSSLFDPSNVRMYVLGSEDNDTDEYDRSVVQHEFGHYLESVLSRTNSIGGQHSTRDRLDMRVAFSEGFANAFTGYYSGSGIYEDSKSMQQSGGFRFSLETKNPRLGAGWYSEASIGYILFDIADPVGTEQNDMLALGFWPILSVLRSEQYRESPSLTSIFTFADAFEANRSVADANALTLLKAEHNIIGLGPYGAGEENDGGVSVALPIYRELSVGGVVTDVCSRGDADRFFNALDVRRFVRFSLSESARYRIDIVSSANNTGFKNPDAVLFRAGIARQLLSESTSTNEVLERDLPADDYVLEVYDVNNSDREKPGGAACFTVSLRRL